MCMFVYVIICAYTFMQLYTCLYACICLLQIRERCTFKSAYSILVENTYNQEHSHCSFCKEQCVYTQMYNFTAGDTPLHQKKMSPEMSKKFDEWIEEKFTKGMGITFPSIK